MARTGGIARPSVRGFALVVSSLNIYRRKRLALWLVAALASFSVVFHVAKGADYEEALLSLALLACLFLARQLKNLVGDPSERRKRDELLALLRRWILRTSDRVPYPSGRTAV